MTRTLCFFLVDGGGSSVMADGGLTGFRRVTGLELAECVLPLLSPLLPLPDNGGKGSAAVVDDVGFAVREDFARAMVVVVMMRFDLSTMKKLDDTNSVVGDGSERSNSRWISVSPPKVFPRTNGETHASSNPFHAEPLNSKTHCGFFLNEIKYVRVMMPVLKTLSDKFCNETEPLNTNGLGGGERGNKGGPDVSKGGPDVSKGGSTITGRDATITGRDAIDSGCRNGIEESIMSGIMTSKMDIMKKPCVAVSPRFM